MRPCILALGTVLVLGAFSTTSAQGLAVQQPSVATSGVATTVNVPDRGAAHLGGVGRSAASSGRYGFSPFGSNTGRQTSGGSMSVHVTIHDFDAMDRALLGQSTVSSRAAPLSGPAGAAFRHLHRLPAPQLSVSDDARPNLPSTDEYLTRGRKAAAEGRVELAKTYFRLAAGRGSKPAADELARLTRVAPVPQPKS